MQIQSIQLNNFRCFSHLQLTIDAPLVLICGLNGTGKTSLLEALHYACYLRSFRTHMPREILHFDQSHFFIKLNIHNELMNHEIQIGLSGKKKLVKIDQRAITSYKELLNYYRIITLTEDDLVIIKGGPEERRLFLDQGLTLENPEFIAQIRNLKHIVQQRNALLEATTSTEMHRLWTEQLWRCSQDINIVRKTFLVSLLNNVQQLLDTWFDGSLLITGNYQARAMLEDQDFEGFLVKNDRLFNQEYVLKRSLFGAHLDDFTLSFKGKTSKIYASRGQQKLIILLLKIAQLQSLAHKRGTTGFLLDDFMNDFDHQVATRLLMLLLSLKNQLIFTAPTSGGFFEKKLLEKGCQHLILSG